MQGARASGLSIIMGLHDKDSKRQGKPEEYSISKLIGHPGFGRVSVTSKQQQNDVKMTECIEFSRRIKKQLT